MGKAPSRSLTSGHRMNPTMGWASGYASCLMKDMCKLCGRISTSLLMAKEARQVLHQRLIPKVGYKMKLTSLTQWQCKAINTLNMQAILKP